MAAPTSTAPPPPPPPAQAQSDAKGNRVYTWSDGPQIVCALSRQNKAGKYPITVSYHGAVINAAVADIENLLDRERLTAHCQAEDGAVLWLPRLTQIADDLRTLQEAAAAARRPDPLRRAVSPAQPYPVDALGPVLAPMVKAIMATLQAPDAICAQSVLAAADLAVQAQADVVIDGRRFPVSEYFVDIGESGERRSAVDRLALYPHTRYQQSLVRSAEHALQAYENDMEAYRASRGQILKGKGTRGDKAKALLALGAPPLAPLDPLFIVEEPTYEGLIKLLARGQPSIGLFSDEGGRFLGGHGMNEENQQKTVTGLCELWDGKAVTRVRATDASVVLYGKRLSLHLMVQPIIAEGVFGNRLLLEQGFLARCLVCWPTSTMGKRTYKAIDITLDPGVQAYNSVMKTLLETPPALAQGRQNELDPRALSLSREAKRLWVDFHDHVEGQLGEGAALEGVRGFGNKAAEHAARLAGVLTLVENVEAKEIDKEHMKAGIDLVDFYLSETVRLCAAGGVDPDILLAEKLLAWATGQPMIALVDVYQSGPYALRDMKMARRIATLLEEHGWLTRVAGGAEVNGVQRRDVWRVRG